MGWSNHFPHKEQNTKQEEGVRSIGTENLLAFCHCAAPHCLHSPYPHMQNSVYWESQLPNRKRWPIAEGPFPNQIPKSVFSSYYRLLLLVLLCFSKNREKQRHSGEVAFMVSMQRRVFRFFGLSVSPRLLSLVCLALFIYCALLSSSSSFSFLSSLSFVFFFLLVSCETLFLPWAPHSRFLFWNFYGVLEISQTWFLLRALISGFCCWMGLI